ncbi:MAG: tol-pal system-associated acyl-CoA thioesterase [Rhodospirillales bacterium]|nr:tol-pal system-associated acyl-CoA thioesterase [Rhodospirillales bacterium]
MTSNPSSAALSSVLQSEFVHRWDVRIYYDDTDSTGLVYHANYLRFAERARTDMLRDLGFDHTRLLAEDGIAMVVRRLSADYRQPARLDDLLRVETRIRTLRGASMDLDQTIRRNGIDLVRISLKLACITADGRATRVPPALHTVFGRLVDRSVDS